MKDIKTTVYRLPCAGFAEKDGSHDQLGALAAMENAAVPPPGQARLDQDIVAQIFLKVRNFTRRRAGNSPIPF